MVNFRKLISKAKIIYRKNPRIHHSYHFCDFHSKWQFRLEICRNSAYINQFNEFGSGPDRSWSWSSCDHYIGGIITLTLGIWTDSPLEASLLTSISRLRKANLPVHQNPPKVLQQNLLLFQPTQFVIKRLLVKNLPCVFCKVLNNRWFFSSLSISKFNFRSSEVLSTQYFQARQLS